MAGLKYLVIHCTATAEGREVSSADIRRWHTAPVSEGGRGWKQVGYTDLFHLNGGVERLVDNNEGANVDPWEVTTVRRVTTPFPGILCMPEDVPLTARLRRTHVRPLRRRHWRSM